MLDSLPTEQVVVCAVDLHKGSALVAARALHYAATATSADAACKVHLVCIAEPNIANVKPPETMDAPELTGTDRHKIHDFVEHRLAEFAKLHPGLAAPAVEVHTDTGDPAEKIVEMATRVDADLIVLGTHGRTGVKRLLLGSVAEKVVRFAGCPVLVVREKRHGEKD